MKAAKLKLMAFLAVCVLAVAFSVGVLAAALRPTVSVTRIASGPVVQAFYSTGTISPEREYPIRAQVTGVVASLSVDKGSTVKRNDLLAVVDDPKLTENLATAQANLREAAALADEKTSPSLLEFDARLSAVDELLAIARREYDRILKMRDINASSMSDLDRSMDRVMSLTSDRGAFQARRASAVLTLRKQVEVAEAAVRTAQAELDKQNVRAPIDGVVLDRPTPFGTHVDAVMANHLMTLADVRQEALVMRAQVDEEDIAKVAVGQAVKMTLYAYANHVFTGTVKRIYDKADPDRRTFEVDVHIDAGDKRLNAGMTGELAFIQEQKASAWILPAQCVQVRIRTRREGEPKQVGPADSAAAAEAMAADEVRETVVWTVHDGKLHALPVTLGLKSIESVEVLSPLDANEQVVTSAIDGRTPEGKRVKVKNN